MSEKSTNTTMEQEQDAVLAEEPVVEETVIEAPVIEEPVTDEPMIDDPVVEEPVVEETIIEGTVDEASVVECLNDSAEGEAVEQVEAIYEQAEVQTAPVKKKVSVKSILLFARNHIFTAKVCSIILLCLGISITLLGVAQLVFWGLSIKDTYTEYWNAIKYLDVINIGIMVFMVLFILALLGNTLKSIISLIKKGHEPRFEIVSTLFAFCIFSMFVTKTFDDTKLLIGNLNFSPILKILLGLVIGYALIRLLVKDFGSRICPFAFSCGAIVLVIIICTQNIGNFATYTAGSFETSLKDLNAYNYLQTVFDLISGEGITVESQFFRIGKTLNLSGVGVDETLILIFLQFIPVMVAHVLPFAAMSLLGYLMFGLTCRNYLQYYNLQVCKRVSVTMLVVSIFSLAATIGLHYICKTTEAYLTVEVNYVNAITTVLFSIVMIILTSLPWKFYKAVYRHRYATYQKNGGGN